MQAKIKFSYGDEKEGTMETLNKLEAEQKILELFETEEIKKIEILIKKESQKI